MRRFITSRLVGGSGSKTQKVGKFCLIVLSLVLHSLIMQM